MLAQIVAFAFAAQIGIQPVTPSRPVGMMGYGGESCGSYTAYVRRNIDAGGYGAWMTGYLSRAAVAHDKDLFQAGAIDFPALKAWMVQWCDAHPLDAFGDGLRILESELVHRAK
jgi:hypothetical protein